jgi:hypothetical protein
VTDLVQRLRDSVTQARAIDRAALLNEAADEIERLLLTDDERKAVGIVASVFPSETIAATLRGLLERSR